MIRILKGIIRRLGLTEQARTVLIAVSSPLRLLVMRGWIKPTALPPHMLVPIGSSLLAHGNHDAALQAYMAALESIPDDIPLLQQIGVTTFLHGKYDESERWFDRSHRTQLRSAARLGVADNPNRILDHSWLLAIGHVAFLDTYLKTTFLGWVPQKRSILAYDAARPPSGWPLFKYLGKYMEIVPAEGSREDAIDAFLHGPIYRHMFPVSRGEMQLALSHSFWFGPDATGRNRWFAPYGAAVEAAWKASGRGPLLVPTEDERAEFRRRMEQTYGLPADAWFVLLHVREPGYHAAWHKRHPGTRNAEIQTYAPIIDFVIAQGGWVVRGGDPSMTKLAPRERVIDYATAETRAAEIDILLCAECRYFVGTNSGYSVVPPTFGRRCALTNWSPIAIPNWYPDDVYTPKLVRRARDGQLLTFTELYSTIAGWSQFERDFAAGDLVIEDNSADDLLATVEELHAEITGTAAPVTSEDAARLRRYNEIACANGGYVGSRMSYRFLEKYASLLA